MNKISKLNQRMVILKEELKHVKETFHKTENENNFLNDKRELLNKKDMEILQEASEKLQESQKEPETATEVINHKERKKKEASRTARLMWARKKHHIIRSKMTQDMLQLKCKKQSEKIEKFEVTFELNKLGENEE